MTGPVLPRVERGLPSRTLTFVIVR